MKRMLFCFAVLLAGCRNAPPEIRPTALNVRQCYVGDILTLKVETGKWECIPSPPSEAELHAIFAEGMALESECMLDIVERGIKPEQSENCRAKDLPWPGPMKYYEKKFPVKEGKP